MSRSNSNTPRQVRRRSPHAAVRGVPAMLVLAAAMLAPGLGSVSLAEESGAPTVTTQAPAVMGVSINSADAARLAESLAGVGQSKAEAIVRYREQFGPFESIEELVEVKGIGAAILERNRGNIRLD